MTVTVRVLAAHIAEARAIIPSGDALTVQAVTDRLVRSGLDHLRATPESALSCLQSAGRAAPFGLLPAIVEAVSAAGTEEEAVGAICGVVGA